jgi:large subunit ribosomal protein L8e
LVTTFSDIFAEASRAKHKFAVKRNSWPKTRGVAMNPVDHPHGVRIKNNDGRQLMLTRNRVVTINILVRPRQSQDMLHKVKRLVSSLLGELVCCVVPKRSRTKEFYDGIFGILFASGMLALHYMYLSVGAWRESIKDLTNA